jgi:hypothetical protein
MLQLRPLSGGLPGRLSSRQTSGALAHLTNNTHNFFRRKIPLHHRYVERRPRETFRLHEEYLAVATLYFDLALSACSL